MSACTDNPRLGLIGCGQTYSGELQHSVARVPWSTFPDGRAHVTAKLTTIDLCWKKGRDQMADPATLGFARDERGIWRKPISDEDRARRDSTWSSGESAVSVTHETRV